METTSSNPNPSSNILLVILVILAFILVITTTYFGYQNYQLKNQARNSVGYGLPSPSAESTLSAYPTPTTSASTDPTADWKTYTNSIALYQVRYPNTWRLVQSTNSDGFGPNEIGEDVLWGINIYDKNVYTKEKLIDEDGKQFSDRKQSTNDIVINGIQATRLITTTPSIPDWYSERIIIEHGSSFITISNGAINDTKLQTLPGVPKGTTFKDFYSTFKFTN